MRAGTDRVVLDSTAARGPGRDAEINGELGLPPALAQHAAARLVPVDPMDHTIERLHRVNPDGHRAAHTLDIDAGDEFLRLACLGRDLKINITYHLSHIITITYLESGHRYYQLN